MFFKTEEMTWLLTHGAGSHVCMEIANMFALH